MSNRRRTVAIAIAVFALAACVGNAFATGPGRGAARNGASSTASDDAHLGPISVASSFLGLSTSDLLRRLRSGASLADVAAAQGVSLEGLEQVLLANLKRDLDADVAAGRIGPDRVAQILAVAPPRIAADVARSGLRSF
jgi:hypothetical protein